jgi:hypothetical protein
MINIIFWSIILIIAAIVGAYVFLLIGSIKNKSHNQKEGSKIIAIILATSIIGFSIFAWNTFSLVNSLNLTDLNLPSQPGSSSTSQPKTTETKKSESKTPQSTDNYFNF